MKIRIYSDLHLEFGFHQNLYEERGDEELVILAGDIHVGVEGVLWAVRTFPHVPVAYVLGNHEHYHQRFGEVTHQCHNAARGTNVHVLEREALDVGPVRILGCTLWTDFACYGQPSDAMAWALECLPDFRVIRHLGLPITPDTVRDTHLVSAKWLDEQITAADSPVVVVTHHAPTLQTGDPVFEGKPSTPSFHSNRDALLRPPVRLWVHGHTHFNADARVHGVRMVANQWGYPNEAMRGFRRDGLFDVEI